MKATARELARKARTLKSSASEESPEACSDRIESEIGSFLEWFAPCGIGTGSLQDEEKANPPEPAPEADLNAPG